MQRRKPDLHRVFGGVAKDDQREDKRIREHRQSQLRKRQDDARIDLPFRRAVETGGLLEFARQRLDEGRRALYSPTNFWEFPMCG